MFRSCLNAQTLTGADVQRALGMIDARNITVHIYKEEIAEQVALQLPHFTKLMRKIIIAMQP